METFIYASKVIKRGDRAALKSQVLTKKNPIGASFLELYGTQDNNLYQYLFDGHSQYLYEQKDERPSIIVGRKGAGKTTYINNLSFKKNIIPISITPWKIMDEVQQIICTLIDNGFEIRAERASYIWQWLFLTAVALKSFNKIKRNKPLKEFAEFFPIKEFGEIGLSAITSFVKNKMSSYFDKNLTGEQADLASVAWIIEDKTSAIDSLEISISNELEKCNKTAIILFDNEEDVLQESITVTKTNLQEAKEIAISGLLNLCGRFNEGAVNVQVRYCIPAEQFFAFKNLSKTTGKDFSNLHLLHWSVGELLSMVAHRYLLFLYIWREEHPELKPLYRELVEIKIYTREGALKFFNRLLPEFISNGRNINEKTLTYILRHFQILPRQIVTLFNSILSLTIKENGDIGKISELTVLKSVHLQEAGMADEIIKAYDSMYPEARKIRKKVLPNIPLIFHYKDLRGFYDGKEFINKGKSVLHSMKGRVEVSPDRMERCLIETGIIGRVLSKPLHSGYINAEFEYSMPGSLDLCEDDELVIHPIFSGQRIKTADVQFGKYIYGVYPHDADPFESPDRDLMRDNFISKYS